MTIKTRNIADGAVTSAKLAAGAVNAAAVGAGSVTAAAYATLAAAAAVGGTSDALRVGVVNWSFATDGAPVAVTITPIKNVTLPINSIVFGALMSVLTPPTSNAATVAVGTTAGSSNASLLVAAATSGAPWSTTGLKALLPVFTSVTAIKLTAAGSVLITANANFSTFLAAANVDIFLIYMVGTG